MQTEKVPARTGTKDAKPKYDYTVFIGRFQPFHIGHKRVVDEALARSNTLIICIGSAQYGRRLRNPFTFEERCEMIKAVYPKETAEHRIVFVPIHDMTYQDEQWVAHVQQSVEDEISRNGWTDKPPSIALIGCKKDNSSYFLSLFPQWDSIPIEPMATFIHATDIRNKLFGATFAWTGMTNVPDPVANLLVEHWTKPWFTELAAEYSWIQDYREKWKGTPFPVTFVAVDAVVVQSGHILLIKRGQMPGKGMWALPGGFLDPRETLYDACVRELKEECNIKLSDFSLKAAYKHSRTFDDPYRSDRGRMLTTAFLFKLENRPNLPDVSGGDDAAHAQWVPLSEINDSQMFGDHAHIIKVMLGSI